MHRRTQSKGRAKKIHPTTSSMEVVIKNQDKNNSELCDVKKKWNKKAISTKQK